MTSAETAQITKARPILTFPEAEVAKVTAACQSAAVILEYGSGGSTVLAGALPDKTVFSDAVDAQWSADLNAWFAQTPSPGRTSGPPTSLTGRMARFDLAPRSLSPDDLALFVDAFSRPAQTGAIG